MSFFCINCRSRTDPGFKACPYCGDPITDFLRRYTEEPIDGKYKILSRLGIGGMGEVYKVLHLHLNAPRVVKMMRPNLSGDERAHERFIREAQLATRIQHPNVAALFDFSTLGDGSYYMVWEYIDGITFADLLRAGGFLSPRYAASLSLQVLDGLQAIHRQGVVHRDVSPENAMITFDDEGNERVKIIDLGIAKQWTNETDDKTKTGMFVGKWKYCSPEHLGMLKPAERIDGRADLYSYGIVLYELLTGRVPFIADSPHRFLLLHSTESPPPLAETNPKLGDVSDLESILFRSLEKDRDKRFRSARQFASAIEAILPSLADSPGLPTGAARPEIATGEMDVITVESEPDSADRARSLDDDATIDERAPDAATAETVESGALVLEVGDTPFLAADPHATSEGGADPQDQVIANRTNRAVTQDTESDEIPSGDAFRSIDNRTLAQAPIELPDTPDRRAVWPWGLLVAAAVIIGGMLVLFRARPETVTTPVVESEIVETAPTAVRATTVGVHAWPWGEIETLRNDDTGEVIDVVDPVTPVAIDLQPGRYSIVMSHPGYSEDLSHSFEVHQGELNLVNVQFERTEEIVLPDLGDSR